MGTLPWNNDLPVLKEDAISAYQIENVINMRQPYQLCEDLDPEFGLMLSHVQCLQGKQKPDYKQLKQYLDQIKERRKLQYLLEWSAQAIAGQSQNPGNSICNSVQRNSRVERSRSSTKKRTQAKNENTPSDIINEDKHILSFEISKNLIPPEKSILSNKSPLLEIPIDSKFKQIHHHKQWSAPELSFSLISLDPIGDDEDSANFVPCIQINQNNIKKKE